MKLTLARLKESITIKGISETVIGNKPTHGDIQIELDEATGLVWFHVPGAKDDPGVHVSSCREIRAAKVTAEVAQHATQEQPATDAPKRGGKRPAKVLGE